MRRNQEFGRLLRTGIANVAGRQAKLKSAVESEIGSALGYGQDMVRYWQKGHVPGESVLEYLVDYCVRFGFLNKLWAGRLLHQAAHPDAKSLLSELFPGGLRLFLSYQRKLEADELVAWDIVRALHEYHVFCDQEEVINREWVERIQHELNLSDVAIFLLSAESIHSEMMLRQLEMVHQLRRSKALGLLPVWLGHCAGLTELRHAAFEGLTWAFWQDQRDTPRLIEELKEALTGGRLPLSSAALLKRCKQQVTFFFLPPTPAAPRSQLELPESILGADSRFYIERQADLRAATAIARQGVTITIKGSRQMGKSSLLQRLAQVAQQREKRFVWLDCSLLKVSDADAESFFTNFCEVLTDEVGLESRLATWKRPLTNAFRCTKYVRQEILRRLEEPCVLAIDQAEALFDTTYRTSFFGMLRTWHNNRAAKRIWRQLDLVVVTSTEPYFFIDNLQQSPFNVGEVIELQDFTAREVAEMNHQHGSPLTPAQVQELMELVRGHPYLVRRALYLVGSRQMSATELFKEATNERGPFGDHLRALLWLLHTHDEVLRTGLRQVMRDKRSPNETLFFRLRGAGLVRREQGDVIPRCQLYAKFFKGHLND
jgi:hypothetical protein